MTAVADVIPLPVTEQSAEALLERMAERDAPLFEVRPWAASSLTEEELVDAWEEFREAIRVRDGLGTGMVTWQEEYPELTCSDRKDVAEQLACERADEARRYLLDGAS